MRTYSLIERLVFLIARSWRHVQSPSNSRGSLLLFRVSDETTNAAATMRPGVEKCSLIPYLTGGRFCVNNVVSSTRWNNQVASGAGSNYYYYCHHQHVGKTHSSSFDDSPSEERRSYIMQMRWLSELVLARECTQFCSHAKVRKKNNSAPGSDCSTGAGVIHHAETHTEWL